MSEAQLTLAIARGEACALLLASDAVAADGSAVLLAGGVALAAAAAARKIPILLVATSSSAAVSKDAEALARRITEADETELHAAAGGSVAARSVAAGVTVRAPRYEILAAGVAERI